MLDDLQSQYIITNYQKMTAVDMASALTDLGHPIRPNCIRYHLSRVGLSPKRALARWPEKAQQWLIDNYANATRKEILENVKRLYRERKWIVIAQYANRLGLKRSYEQLCRARSEGKKRAVHMAMTRLELGLDPKVGYRNFGNRLSMQQRNIRWKAKTKFQYVIIPFDHTVYYSDSTQRDAELERQITDLGLIITHISNRQQ